MKRIPLRALAFWGLMALLMAVSVLLLFDNLGVSKLEWADESRHGINAYEMMEGGHWAVHTYRGETDYWNLKPPLSYWLIGLGYRVFGYNAVGLRFYSAASTLGLMGLLALWTRKRYGELVSLVSQLFLMGCALVYKYHFARHGDADALFVLLYTLAMMGMVECRQSPRWLYISALCFGFGFLCKSWHAAIIPVTCFAFVCLSGDIKRLKPKHYLGLIACGLLPVLPWAVARFRFDGLTFFRAMFGTDVVTRATTTHEGHEGGWLYYAAVLLSDPATVLALVAALAGLIGGIVGKKRLGRDTLALTVWVAVPVVLYTLCVSKLQWYIFPVLPGLGIALGLVAKKLAESNKRRILCRVALALCAAFLLVCTAGNLYFVRTLRPSSYDSFIAGYFNRERDRGRHVYIQYENQSKWGVYDKDDWMQGDVLSAQWAGDMCCMDGNTAAFVNDPEPAYLITHVLGREEDTLQGLPMVYDKGQLAIYKNAAFE